MARKSKDPLRITHAGVRKAKKYDTNKYRISNHDQGGHTPVTATSQPRNMLVFNDINFTPLVIKAMMATVGNDKIDSISNPPNPASFFVSLPTELLLQILDTLPVEDLIRLALTFPEFFMNDNRVNVFTIDAYRQLDVRTHRIYTLTPEILQARLQRLRNPLILDAILPESGSFSADEINIILKQYEKVCVDNQIDPQAFLNCVFPDEDRPANVQQPLNRPDALDLKSPLHVAVEAGRDDIVQLLIQLGANVNRTFRQPGFADKLVTPFQWGIEFRGSLVFGFAGADRTRIRRIENLLLKLASTSSVAAYTPQFEMTREMNISMIAGMDRLVLLFLKRFEDLVIADRGSDRHQAVRDGVLQSVLMGRYRFPMPQTIRFMLDHGGNVRFINRDVMTSVTVTALNSNIEENIVAALQWEIETQAVELPSAISSLALLATRDANLYKLRPLANEFIRHNHYQGQAQLLGFSIIAGTNAPNTRKFLLNAVTSDVLNGEALRVAIRYRDRRTISRVLESMSLRGQSIDEELPMQEGVPNLGHWFNTPLTYALAQENYFEAATLLSIEADPSKIPPNIRHRVRVIKDRIDSGDISDSAFFVFRGLNLDAYPVPVLQEADWALNYVFSRLLNDERYPLPNYVRVPRHQNLPIDHEDNDSEREDPPEDDPILKGEYP